MHYAEIVNSEKAKKKFFSTNICHPSMANNEISGICLLMGIAQYIQSNFKTNYTYRFLFIPETIGSINYISDNFKNMKKNFRWLYNFMCR